ncbi:hypothetical protein [Pontibacter sp. BAB1700]|uniref:hypothetical protein n=1 Tax=Pontibacter sp. BAB1700 TaxID=1144253 RepID=UPI00026BE429|nr:hypothetical protein O71_18236 [Pontibacter sp. BAB1700]
MSHLKTLILAVCLLLSASAAIAQSRVYLEPRLGFGTFRMQSMKELQRVMIANTDLNAKATDTFGSYAQFGLNVVSDLGENTRIGGFIEHGSTGGRVAYSDYSGEFLLDTPLNYNAFGGLFYHHQPIKESTLRYVVGAELHMLMTNMKLQAYTKINNTTESSEDKFNSYGLGLKPFVGLQYPFLDFPTTLSLGYLLDTNYPFHVPGEPKQQLRINSNNKTLQPGWGGLRINLAVSIPIVR